MEKTTASHLEAFRDQTDLFTKEAAWAKYIPGYSNKRCMKLKGRPMILAILCLAGCSIMFFGYDSASMTQVNLNQNYLRMIGEDSGSSHDSAAVGGLVSLWFGGFAIGAVLTGAYADKIGRLRTMQIGCVWAILGAALLTSAMNITWVAFARVINGIGCGHLNTIVPVWTSELADPNMRGVYVAFQFTLAIAGGTTVYWIEYACAQLQSPVFAWRFPLGLQIVFLLFIMVASPFYPESPRYLLKIGRMDDARAVLASSRLHKEDASPPRVEAQMLEIMEAIRLEASSDAPTYWKLLTHSDPTMHTRRRVLLGAGVQVMQKFTGIDFISTYAPEMFSLAGYTGTKPKLLAGGNFFGYMASLAIAMYLSDHLGRRKLMLIGCLLMCIVLIVGGVLSHLVVLNETANPAKASRYGAGITSMLYIYTFVYGGTWLTTCWVYPTEVFPLAIRAKGTALATVAFSLAGGFINEIVPYLISAVGFWVLIIFALINLVMLVPIYLFYIETSGYHLEDLDYLLSNKSPFFWVAERDFAAMKAAQAVADTAEPEKLEFTLPTKESEV